MGVGTQEAREKVYAHLNVPSLSSLAFGGIFPAEQGGSLSDRLRRGPHVVYYVQQFQRKGYRLYAHQVAVEIVVPDGQYTLGTVRVGAYEYAIAILDAVNDALEADQHGARGGNDVLVGAYAPGDGFELWQVLVNVPVTLPN